MKYGVAIAGVMVAVAGVAAADEVEPYTLGEVQVVAEGEESSAANSVDAALMRERSSNDVATAVATLPGVTSVTVGARGEQQVLVRGFDLRQTPLFVDGIPVYVPYDGNVDLGRFTTFDLARIDVAKGFSSTLYGANTLGGAINLVSRKPQSPFEGEMGGAMQWSATGQQSGYYSYANFGSRQKLFYLQASLSYLDSDGYRLPDSYTAAGAEDGGLRENSYRQDQKINIKAAWTPANGDEYSFNFIDQQAEKGSSPYAGTSSSQKARYWQWPRWDKKSYYFISNTHLGEGELKVRLYHDSFDNALSSYDDATYTSQNKGYAFNSHYDDDTYGGSATLSLPLANHLLSLAYHYKEDIHREQDDDAPMLHFKDRLNSVGLEDSISIGESLSVVAGAGFDQLKAVQAEQNSGGVIGEFDKFDQEAVNGQLGGFWQVNSLVATHLTWAHKNRFPTLKDRYSYRIGTAVPSPDLDVESADHFELGTTLGSDQSWQLGGALFFSRVQDLIQSTSIDDGICSNPPCSQMVNIGRVNRYGVETSGSWNWGDWALSGNYTWLHQDNRSSDAFLTNAPEHSGYVSLNYYWGELLTVLLTEKADSSRYSSSDGSRKAAGFAVTDLRFDLEPVSDLHLNLGVTNLFDTLYSYEEGGPMAGRSYELRADYRF